MYLDTYASLNWTETAEPTKNPLVDVELHGFDNSLYKEVDPVYEELPETPYDTLQKPQDNGVYEEPMMPNIYIWYPWTWWSSLTLICILIFAVLVI